ncbi:gliding motility-associated C-terminal domain-containing protein [Segetibacter sp.]|jgi:gliding motility-associated-like protein|uniref:gliding motility-associated C-terminal domain-containing protein n=1 Tax=Segetibacter sp. TaxID=2231182 RepID=UPI00262A70C4|nr:gliding motility-associated C-terminal domain-containing protein [Segetibacter sp.]MCW3080834.1 gliding motility-associated C-terminal protein [Segetibacter sp.]
MKIYLFLFLLIFSISISLKAQVCNGGSGDPIVNVTFGTSQAPLSTKKTSLSFVGGCPFDTGSYTIRNLIFGCGENPQARSWHMLAGDHTRDVNGQYMLVNASWALGLTHSPVIIHLDTATALCPNTTYQYSAWLANVMGNLACGGNPLLPDITFTVSSISGVVLATSTSGKLPVRDGRIWQQNGLTFTTPPNVDAVILTLSTDPERGCGNAFVVDDITLSVCGPAVQATIDGKTEPANVCADYANPFILNGSYSNGFRDPVVQWQNSVDRGNTWRDMPGITTLSYAIPRRSIGTILYRMAVAERQNIGSLNCRVVSNPIYTQVHPIPPHRAPQDVVGCISKDLRLPETDPSALAIQWTGPNGYSSTDPKSIVPNIKYADTGIYRLNQSFYFGCTSIDTFKLNVFPSTTIATQTLYSICEGNSVALSATGSGTFKWTPATGLSNDTIPNPVASPRDSTLYKVIVTNTFGCMDSAEVKINVFRNPVANAGPDRTIVIGDTVLLNASIAGTAINSSWSPSVSIDNPQLVAPKVSPRQNTEYTLTATSTVGCGTSMSTAVVKVYRDVYIPTAFTPNGDGTNDLFKVFAADGYRLIKFHVYNRWGQVVFTAKESSEGWDGKINSQPQAADTYVYYIELENTQSRKIVKKGTITLIR